MQVWKYSTNWIVIVILPLCYSCVQDIDLEEKRENKIVVNCMLTTDSIQTLTLTYSNPLNQFYYDEVEEATATLYLNDDEVGQFEKTAYSKWTLNHTPEIGGHYRLRVQVTGWEEIEATTTMPFAVRVEKADGSNTNRQRYFRQHYAPNPYWMFVLTQRRDTMMIVPIVESGDKLQTSIGSSHPWCDSFNATEEMVFEGKGTTREHLAYIRITPDKADDDTPFYLEAKLGQSLVFFRSASNEYDLYMKSSVQKMMVYLAFDDPTQWFDENEIYTNINNGLGIFAAYNDWVIQCHYAQDEISGF